MAIKNNNIVLNGIRNPTDGLWDIPVTKHAITPQNYDLPRISPGIYPNKHRKIYKADQNTKIKHAHHHILPDLQALNYLIDHSICDEQIHQQLVQDRKHYTNFHHST